MTTQPSLFTADQVAQHRATKREKIERMFAGHLGQKFSSNFLHAEFGSAFRSRVSEINRGGQIRIKNRTDFNNGVECSVYWAEAKC